MSGDFAVARKGFADLVDLPREYFKVTMLGEEWRIIFGLADGGEWGDFAGGCDGHVLVRSTISRTGVCSGFGDGECISWV